MGFQAIAAITSSQKCKSNKHNYYIVDEVEVVENGVTMILTTYQCEFCYHETTDKRKGKLKHVSFFAKLKSIFNI
jgi:hypothetical protein